jgi:hypothetical protein
MIWLPLARMQSLDHRPPSSARLGVEERARVEECLKEGGE